MKPASKISWRWMMQNGGKRMWFLGNMIQWEVALATATQSTDSGPA
jgi:hypothetical protein